MYVFNSVFLPHLSWTGPVICDKCSTPKIELRLPETKSNRLQVFGTILYRDTELEGLLTSSQTSGSEGARLFHRGFCSQ
jgi:hypothetical protein